MKRPEPETAYSQSRAASAIGIPKQSHTKREEKGLHSQGLSSRNNKEMNPSFPWSMAVDQIRISLSGIGKQQSIGLNPNRRKPGAQEVWGGGGNSHWELRGIQLLQGRCQQGTGDLGLRR